jgi:neopullulanase
MEIKSPGFWERFRDVVKDENPEAYIVGEVWTEAQEWLQGDRFDGVMNYIFAKNAINFFGSKSNKLNEFSHDEFKIEPIDSNQFSKSIREMINLYDWNITCSQLNLLDSHDMPRALWLMGDDQTALKLAVLFQMTMPGAPCIYYGDEIGLSSAGDPHCRGTIPWDDTEKIDNELLSFYKEAIHLRNSNEILRSGDFNEVFTENGVYAFSRENYGEQAIVIFNSNEYDVRIKAYDIADQSIKKVWTFAGERAEDFNFDGRFKVGAREGIVIFLSGLEKHSVMFELQS